MPSSVIASQYSDVAIQGFIAHNSRLLRVLAKTRTDCEFGEYRFRIGDYRVAFDVEKDVAKILKVGHRKDMYK